MYRPFTKLNTVLKQAHIPAYDKSYKGICDICPALAVGSFYENGKLWNLCKEHNEEELGVILDKAFAVILS